MMLHFEPLGPTECIWGGNCKHFSQKSSVSRFRPKSNIPYDTSAFSISTATALSHPPVASHGISPRSAQDRAVATPFRVRSETQPKMQPAKPRGRAAHKSTHSRSYPRGVGLDFRKLAGLTLMSYIDHHGVSVRSEAPPSELAVAVARHFESMEVDEEAVIGGFLARLSAGTDGSASAAGGGVAFSSRHGKAQWAP